MAVVNHCRIFLMSKLCQTCTIWTTSHSYVLSYLFEISKLCIIFFVQSVSCFSTPWSPFCFREM